MGIERLKGTRYRASIEFQPDENGKAIFRGIRPRPITIASGVVEHQLKEGDRLDLLALHYYNNARLWWRIVDANPGVLCALDLSISKSINRKLVGATITIPRADEARQGGR